MSEIKTFIELNHDSIYKIRIREKTASISASLHPQTVNSLLSNSNSIWQVSSVPSVIRSRPQSFETPLRYTVKVPIPASETICVMDTGIDSTHPLLKNIILDAIDLTEDNSPLDTHGHGTFVSGLAAYGQVENKNSFSASAKIISAKILGRNDYPPLEEYIEEIVERYHESCKIYNLCIMYESYSDFETPSEIAYLLDSLEKKYGVSFIISSGNLNNELPQLQQHLQYPTYFGDNSCIVYYGAESCNSITVGGISDKESPNSMAKKNQPAPFTRRGAFNARGKPDVVFSAGNLEKDPNTNQILSNNQLEVISLGISPQILAHDIGTSFSTPSIANLVAQIKKNYPEASHNLLKAFLIHFSSWPMNHYQLNAGNDLKKSLWGKGIPNEYNCLNSHKFAASYYVEDEINFDEVAYVPFYVPEKMKNIYGDKIVRVTLAYDPPVNRGMNGYTLVDLDFKMFKEYVEQKRWEKQFRYTWDNVKTDTYKWQKKGWGKDWQILIIPKTRFNTYLKNNSDGVQKYALVVSIEDPTQQVNIYDSITSERVPVMKKIETYFQGRKVKQPQSIEIVS